jgi:deoxyadenosine/deoxycytidine kinase
MVKAYEQELYQHQFTPPLLVVYLTAPAHVLVDRIKRRGVDWEIEAYDEAYYAKMDAAHRKAFATLGVPFVSIDWSEEHKNGIVPAERCLEILDHALRDMYAKNWGALVDKEEDDEEEPVIPVWK